jgi:hypothetical protein
VREVVQFHPVKTMDEVLAFALRTPAKTVAESRPSASAVGAPAPAPFHH